MFTVKLTRNSHVDCGWQNARLFECCSVQYTY